MKLDISLISNLIILCLVFRMLALIEGERATIWNAFSILALVALLVYVVLTFIR